MSSRITLERSVGLLGLAAAAALLGCQDGERNVPYTPDTMSAAGGTAATPGGGDAGTAGTAGTACVAEGVGGFADAGGASACSTSGLAASFTWKSSGPLIDPISDATHPIVSVKDPTVVFFNDRWHVYATTANTSSKWSMVYLSFTDWSQAASAPQYYIDKNPALGSGYHCAPEVFYFGPQHKWYLVYQSGPPQYSTADDLSQPETWTAPKSFFAAVPAIVIANRGSGGWLDFWVICDATNCHLFFADNNGHWYRSQTAMGDFPNGFGEPVIALSDTKENVFEASNVYKLKGMDKYLALIEAFGPTGRRYFRSFTADRLDGEWTPLAATWDTAFLGQKNVSFDACFPGWTQDLSHGELLRDGYDETLTVDPCRLRFLYQGVAPARRNNKDYSQIPWQLGVATQTN